MYRCKCPYCGGEMTAVPRKDYKKYDEWAAFVFCKECYLRTPLIRRFATAAEAADAAWKVANQIHCDKGGGADGNKLHVHR